MFRTSKLCIRSTPEIGRAVIARGMICLALIGSFVFDRVHAAEDPPGTQKQKPTSEPANGDASRVNTETKVIRGRVIDAVGTPVSGAQVCLVLQYRPRRVVQAMSDESGRFELKFASDWVSENVTSSSWTIWAYGPGHSIGSESPFEVVRGTRQEAVEIKLGPQGTSRFKVVTPAGEPVMGALVQPQNYKTMVGYDMVPEELLSAVSALTNAEGVATLVAVESTPLFRVQVVSEEFGNQAIRVDRGPNQADREIRLREPGKIVGRLIGDRPEWVRGVELSFSTDNHDESTDPEGSAVVTTDDEGKFEIPVLASGGPLRTYIDLDQSLPVRPRLKDDLYVPPGETLQLEIPLVAAPKVFGKVQAKSSGKPVPKAEISLGYGGFRQSDFVVTDKDGRFEGRVLPGPVRAQIIALPGEYMQLGRPWADSYQVPQDVEQFELPTIEVVGTRKLRGRLIGDNGQPLPELQVMAVDEGRRYGFGKTDVEGYFTMMVPEGIEMSFDVSSDDRGQERATVVQREPLIVRYSVDTRANELEVARQSKADVILTGRVLSSGRPLPGVQLTLSRRIPIQRPSDPQGGSSSRMHNVDSVETDSDGRYRLRGLKAGDSYSVEARAPFPASDPAWTHQPPYAPTLPSDAEGEVVLPDLKLSKLTQTLAGKIVDPDGNPVKGATVSAMLADGFTSVARNMRGGPAPWTETDEEGRFRLRQLPDEPLAIMAYMRSRDKGGGRIRFPARVKVERNQQDIRIVLDPSLSEEEE